MSTLDKHVQHTVTQTTEVVQKTVEVFCTLQIAGTHSWPACPYDEVAYLRVPHRHMFHIKAHKIVTHSDRDVEFIMLKGNITDYLANKYWGEGDHDGRGLEGNRLCVFGALSCEMIAEKLILEFDLSRCEVSEDGENGAIVSVEVVSV